MPPRYSDSSKRNVVLKKWLPNNPQPNFQQESYLDDELEVYCYTCQRMITSENLRDHGQTPNHTQKQ